ncbi:MAG: LapA family protein, partial [Alphaproteobacteria bacterium]|nr:LapA family protein [Alphaproteobacteria bacterium]
MRTLYWILAGTLAALAGLFALNNRGELTVDLWPLGPQTQMPVFVALVGALYIGFLFGAVFAWLAGGAARKRAGGIGGKAATLRNELLGMGLRYNS